MSALLLYPSWIGVMEAWVTVPFCQQDVQLQS